MSLAHPQNPKPAEGQNTHRHAELDSASHPRTPNFQPLQYTCYILQPTTYNLQPKPCLLNTEHHQFLSLSKDQLPPKKVYALTSNFYSLNCHPEPAEGSTKDCHSDVGGISQFQFRIQLLILLPTVILSLSKDQLLNTTIYPLQTKPCPLPTSNFPLSS